MESIKYLAIAWVCVALIVNGLLWNELPSSVMAFPLRSNTGPHICITNTLYVTSKKLLLMDYFVYEAKSTFIISEISIFSDPILSGVSVESIRNLGH